MRRTPGAWAYAVPVGLVGSVAPTPTFTNEVRRRVHGYTLGPVLSLPISENVRVTMRAEFLGSTLREDGRVVAYNLPPVRTVTHDTGHQAGLGLWWKPRRRERWQLGTEVLYAETSSFTMTTVVASISRNLDPLPTWSPEERPEIYLAAGNGLAALR